MPTSLMPGVPSNLLSLPSELGFLSANFGQLLSAFAWVEDDSDPGLAVTMASTADAVGTDTYAFADLSMDLENFSWGAIAKGSAETGAIAFGEAGSAVMANTDTALDFCGADFIFILNTSAIGGGFLGDTAWAAELSNTYFFAIDVAGMALPNGPVVLDLSECSPLSLPPMLVDGNLAEFDLINEAKGDDTLTTADIQALTVEDQLSSVSALMLAAVDRPRPSIPDPTPEDPDVIPGPGADNDPGIGDNPDNPFQGGATRFLTLDNDGIGFQFRTFGPVDSGDTPRPEPATDYRLISANDTGLVGGGPLEDDLAVEEEEDVAGGADEEEGGGDGACDVCTVLPSKDAGGHGSGGDADLYDLANVSGCQTVKQFKLRDGDRMVGLGGWSSDAALREANGETLFLERPDCDPQDLVMTFFLNGEWHVVRMDDFFLLNPMFDDVSSEEALSDEEAMPILHAILQHEEETAPQTAEPETPQAVAGLILLA